LSNGKKLHIPKERENEIDKVLESYAKEHAIEFADWRKGLSNWDITKALADYRGSVNERLYQAWQQSKEEGQ